MIRYAAFLLMTLMGSAGALFFKKSTEKMSGVLSLAKIPSFYIGGMLYMSAAMLNVLLLRVMDYTALYPMTAVGYVWSLLLANRFLGERITRRKAAGIALVFVGVMLLARE